ncbi:hypothetical protein JCM33374_g1997 [Metschnikowia sp. JCM 33374]|nr:hypothetical protein JCM33374_g1997 [Metschnikowia sp. JCM 33374]
MGKLKASPNVDLARATISGCLKQIRRSNVSLPENHVPATQKCMKPLDSTDFVHVKRFRKNIKAVVDETTGPNPDTKPKTPSISISTVLCPIETFPEKKDLVDLLRTHFSDNFAEGDLFVGQIPCELPPTKELSVKWSDEIWPLSWKGNPNHQDLITAQFDIEEETALVKQLLRHAAESPPNSSPAITTMIAEQHPTTKKIRVLHLSRDSRQQHVLQHSVMNAIAEVAAAEVARRAKQKNNLEDTSKPAEEIPKKMIDDIESDATLTDGYLCHNLLVYTTHEPCTMCAMALVHSRIGRLVYVNTHPLGAIESSLYIGDRRDLNWTFDIWRWVGPLEETVQVPADVAP